MKYIAGILIVAVLGIGLALMLAPAKNREQAWQIGSPLAKERVKIGVLYFSAPVRVISSDAYSHDAGLRAMQRALGISDSQIIRKTNVPGSEPATMHAMLECIMAGANIIIVTSSSYMAATEALAAGHPNVIFAVVATHGQSSTNLTTYYGRISQAKYLGGIVAGLRTSSNKIGYVAAKGQDNQLVTSAVNAFALGVASVNPKARVHRKVMHRWFDPNGEYWAAYDLIMRGCDVIAQYSDTPGPQIMAQQAGMWGIGYNSDMHHVAPEAVVTSVIWNWGVYYTYLVQSVIDGSFTAKPYLGDLGDGMVGLAPFNEPLLPAGAAEAVAVAREKIVSGQFGVFEGLLKTNDGQLVGVEGRWPDVEIVRNMRWYYHNVVEVE